MADNLAVTPGAGATIATDQATGDSSHIQIIKLAYSADGDKTLVTADADGLEVQIGKSVDLTTLPKSGQVWPVSDNGGVLSVDDAGSSLTVDAPFGTPVAVRLSNGGAFVDAIPVTDNSSTLSVDDGAGSLTVDGTITANQGTPVVVGNSWPVKISDGTDTVGISTVSATKALKVDIVQSVVEQADKTAFTEGTTLMTPVGGVYNDTIGGDPTEDQAAALRITAKRGLHVNLRNAAGTEIGTSADPVEVTIRSSGGTELGTAADPVQVGLVNAAGTEIATAAAPLRIDPTGTTKQPASLFDSTGVAFSATNSLPVTIVAAGVPRVTKSVAITASQTGATVWTPGSGKKFVVSTMIIAISVAGDLTIFDGTDAEANRIFDGPVPISFVYSINFSVPWISSTADNVLKYTSGVGITGKVTLHGYEV